MTNLFPGSPLIESPIVATPCGSIGLMGQEEWITTGINERGIQGVWKFDSDVRAIAVNQGILDFLGELYGGGAFPFDHVPLRGVTGGDPRVIRRQPGPFMFRALPRA